MTIRVGGLTPLSSTDWPGMLAAVVFCQGCPWQCGYCHNPDLIPSHGEHEIAWEAVLELLQRRRGLLDAVVFSGGEPTLQKDLLIAMREVRSLGFKVGLHTSGMYPVRLAALLPLVDWVGLDVKAPFDDYPKTTGAEGSGGRVQVSLEHILASGAGYEIRTTVHPELLNDDAVLGMGRDLAARGVRNYAIQAFRSQGCDDERLCQSATRERPLQEVCEGLVGLFERFSIRS